MNLFGLFKRPQPDPAPQPVAATAVEPARPAGPLRPLEPPPEPGQLRRMLLDAAASGDEGKLACLCREHQDFILQNTAGWLQVPDEFRTSPQVYEWYGDGLRTIARFCADQLGRSELLEHLPATDASRAALTTGESEGRTLEVESVRHAERPS